VAVINASLVAEPDQLFRRAGAGDTATEPASWYKCVGEADAGLCCTCKLKSAASQTGPPGRVGQRFRADAGEANNLRLRLALTLTLTLTLTLLFTGPQKSGCRVRDNVNVEPRDEGRSACLRCSPGAGCLHYRAVP